MTTIGNVYATDWLGLAWTPWLSVNSSENELRQLPTDPGVYRVRHKAYDGLIYIGETGRSVRGRVRSLVRGINGEQMPYSDPHTASPSFWAIFEEHGGGFEISGAAPAQATNDQQRKAIEDALIAVHRQKTETNLIGNFGRMPPGYEKSTSRSTGDRGGPDPTASRSFRKGIDPLPWDNKQALTGQNWLGLSWEPSQQLATVDSEVPAEPGVYRLWQSENVPPLEYIGQSANLRRRLYKHRRHRGGSLLVSYAVLPDLDRQFQRLQVESTLLGAHWLTCDRAPRDQY